MKVSSDYFIYIDIAIALIYLLLIIIGYKKGFLYELISLLYTGISLLASWFLAPILASLYPIVNYEDHIVESMQTISKLIDLNPILNTAIYFVIVFLVLKLIYWILALLIKGINKIPVIGKFNQILGIFAGILNATIITLALSMLLSLPVIDNGKEIKDGTVFKYVDEYSQNVMNYFIENVDLNRFKHQFEDFDVDEARQSFKKWLEIKNGN